MIAKPVQGSRRSRAAQPPLVDVVYERILGMLMDHELAPGAPLRTEALGAEIGVSATPVREALGRLETTGLVERSAHRGWRAAPRPTPADLVNMVDVRLLLEPESARLSCAAADDAVRDELAALVARQRAAPTGPDYAHYRDFLNADWMFHLVIARHSGNPYLARAFTVMNGYWHRWLFFEGNVVTDAEQSTAEHAAVLEAFERRSPVIAAAAMRDHLLRLRDRVAALDPPVDPADDRSSR